MARAARIVCVGLPHHVTQRGNYRQIIFKTHADMEKYLRLVEEYGRKHGLSILAYCLMENHVHFLAVPRSEKSLALTFKYANMRYARYFNQKSRASGHLWQGRFYSCVIGEGRLLAAARYIERNPVRAGLEKNPEKWKWSSAAAHCGCGKETRFDLGRLWDYSGVKKSDWRNFLREKDAPEDLADIRGFTQTGRPLGSRKFISTLEKKLGRRLHPLRVGRPLENK